MKSKNKYITIINHYYPYFIFVFVTILLLIRARYGFCWSDESYYIAGANRILRGDRFLTDEWYISQLFNFTVVPIIALYKAIIGSWEGVYLFYRIVYVLIHSITCTYLYRVLVKHNNKKIVSMLSALVILFYSRAYINTFSYYAAILVFYIWSLMIIYNYREKRRGSLFFAGLFLGGVIVINPYFVIPVLILLFCFFVQVFWKKTRVTKDVIYFLAGLAVYGAVFLLFLLKGNSFSEIYQCSFWWAESDGYKLGVTEWWTAFRHVAGKFKFTIIPSTICIVATVILALRGGMTQCKSLIIFSISFVIFVINCLLDNSWDGVIQTNFSILGLQVFLLTPNKKWDIFNYFYLPGLVLAFLMNLSSDTGFSAMSVGFALSGGVSCIFIYEFISLLWTRRVYLIVRICGFISMCVVVFFSGFCRIVVVYRDSELQHLKTEILEGPAKGLYTTNEHYKQYEEVLRIMKQYCSGEGNVLILSLCPWAYLCTDMYCSGYTTWRITMDANESKLKAYYNMHPERFPDIVIDLNENIGEFDILNYWKDVEWFSVRPQYDLKRHSSFLWDYMQIDNYNCISTEIGDVWISEKYMEINN